MKIAVCSDIHLEFGPIELKNSQDADVLILSGDICVANDLFYKEDNAIGSHKSQRYHEFFQTCCQNFPHVIYIMGNHEHYHFDFAKTYQHLKDRLGYLNNLYLLEKETLVLDDVTFIGGTLWTNMNDEDTSTMRTVLGLMNDYRGIKNSNRVTYYTVPIYEKDENGIYKVDDEGMYIKAGNMRKEEVAKFSPEDSVEDHKKFVQFIDEVTKDKWQEKFVVVGHHAPSKQSTHPRYADEFEVNGAYSSDLNEFIAHRPQIKLWTHGHTHEDFDYCVGSTRVVCNPRGYQGYESKEAFFELKFFTV